MPKYYEPGFRHITAEEHERRDITSPRFEWPAHKRVWVEDYRVGDDRRVGDVVIVGDRRVVILAHEWPRGRRYLVAPDSPTVGINVMARVLGRMVRRANIGLKRWAMANELMTTPEAVIMRWSDFRLPWRWESRG